MQVQLAKVHIMVSYVVSCFKQSTAVKPLPAVSLAHRMDKQQNPLATSSATRGACVPVALFLGFRSELLRHQAAHISNHHWKYNEIHIIPRLELQKLQQNTQKLISPYSGVISFHSGVKIFSHLQT